MTTEDNDDLFADGSEFHAKTSKSNSDYDKIHRTLMAKIGVPVTIRLANLPAIEEQDKKGKKKTPAQIARAKANNLRTAIQTRVNGDSKSTEKLMVDPPVLDDALELVQIVLKRTSTSSSEK